MAGALAAVSTKKRNPNQLNVAGKPGEDQADALARTLLQPTVQAAFTLKKYVKSAGDLELSGLIDSLTEQTRACSEGDLKRPEAMLTAQAHTLDAIFNNLAQRAINAKYMDELEPYLKLALRGRCCTARSKSLTSLCRLQSHPAQYVSGIPSAVILLSISHPIRCSTRCLANVRARISGPMIAL